jgi:hypothetical protein
MSLIDTLPFARRSHDLQRRSSRHPFGFSARIT